MQKQKRREKSEVSTQRIRQRISTLLNSMLLDIYTKARDELFVNVECRHLQCQEVAVTARGVLLMPLGTPLFVLSS